MTSVCAGHRWWGGGEGSSPAVSAARLWRVRIVSGWSGPRRASRMASTGWERT